MTGQRVAPHSMAAEESLLGACLLARDAIAAAAEVVRPADFYKPAHVHIFDAIVALHGRGDPVDPITVADELTRAGVLDLVGGGGALVALQAGAPVISSAARYARIVEEHAVLRRMIGAAGEIAELGYSLPDDVDKAVDSAEAMVFDLAQHRNAGSTSSIRSGLEAALDALEQRYERGESITGLATGFIDLDELTSGLQPGTLTVIGSRPAMGKALALDTPLPTPTGWTTMGEVQTGDRLVDEQGRPCVVTAVTPVQYGRDCYAVNFDDRTTIVADADHQWFAYDLPAWKSKRGRCDRLAAGPPPTPSLARDKSAWWKNPRVVTTRQMIIEGVTAGTKDRRPNWYLPLACPLDLPEVELRLDPYLLGAWLGDGNTSGARITSEDDEIVQTFRDAGYHMEPKVRAGNAWTYSVSYGHSTSKPWLQKMPDAAVMDGRARVAVGEVARDVAKEMAGRYGYSHHDYVLAMLTGPARPFAAEERPSFVAALIDLGVIRRKHIPAAYLRASAKQRLALLQGLLDTDGSVTGRTGVVELGLVNRDLLAQARELVCSLGEKPSLIQPKTITLHDGRLHRSWRFTFTPNSEVFRLSRKAEALAARRLGRINGVSTRRAVRSIEPVGSVPVRCIAVDSPSSLYLAGESMIPTHNTSVGLGMASHCALVERRPALVFSLEMSQSEITQRVMCSEARVDATRMRNGKLSDNDWEKIGHAVGRLAEAPLWVDDNPNVTVMEIRSKARKLKSQLGDLGLVVVDYVQLMTGRSSADNRQVEVAEISRGLKILAREVECPVVALAQLNRGLEQRADKRPQLSDLRESGALEQDADLVLMLYRDEVYHRETVDAGIAEVIVAKHRSGPTGLVRLAFLPQYARFANMAHT